ncbi:MAG: hypothetical protein NVS2B3_13190 [Vulcanimicrobiaceae bacterium]
MNDIRESARRASPVPKPQSLAFDGTTLWMGSIATERIYALEPETLRVGEVALAPGKPWGIAVAADELRVLCGEAPDDNRFVRRYRPGRGFTGDAVACPDDTGSQLSYDGRRLYVSQWYRKRLLALDERGAVEATVAAPRGICGQVFVDGRFYLVTTDDETSDAYFLTRIDARGPVPIVTDLARVGFAARSLAYDGARFWTNHREADQIVSFEAPL